ncbi:MAG TPA: sigma-70 family RNA polymerase sigma factor [Actinomycetota bacterium]|nr:sigma-70 family RNA polymerase sigma factor [Actinomycetota bacterium]
MALAGTSAFPYPDPPDDEGLASRAAHDFAAFAELYQRYLEPVYRYVRSQTRDRATAEDLTAQVFFKALSAAATFKGDGSYRAWIFTIARNTVASWRADRKSRLVPIEDLPDPPDPAPSAQSLAIASEDRALLWSAVARLPEAQREVVRLRYRRDLTIEEIARVTRRSSGAVRVLLHRARARLGHLLKNRDLP